MALTAIRLELPDIDRSLGHDDDGMCRDVNFEGPTWAGVRALSAWLMESFKEHTATDHNGLPIAGFGSGVLLAPGHEYCHATFAGGGGLFQRLQAFISAEDDGSPFVELTFFPDDFGLSNSLRDRFLEWATQVCSLLQARRYFREARERILEIRRYGTGV